jgi:hypothetical protein
VTAAAADTYGKHPIAVCSIWRAYRYPIDSPLRKDIEVLFTEANLPERFSVSHGICEPWTALWSPEASRVLLAFRERAERWITDLKVRYQGCSIEARHGAGPESRVGSADPSSPGNVRLQGAMN